MSKFKKQTWNGDGPEPADYAYQKHPFDGSDFSVGRKTMLEFVSILAQKIKEWALGGRSGNFDKIIDRIKKDWRRQGGSSEKWYKIEELAILQSDYFRIFSRESKPLPIRRKDDPYLPINKENIPISKEQPKFNGLDFSTIKLKK